MIRPESSPLFEDERSEDDDFILNPMTVVWTDDDHITMTAKNQQAEQLSRLEVTTASK